MPERSWWRIDARADDVTEVVIYDEIGEDMWGEGISARELVARLQTITTPRIRVRLNSPGGNVFDGLAIYNALAAHPATVEVQIDGLAASIASVIALAGRPVTAPAASMMMIHNPRGIVMGDHHEMQRMAGVLAQVRTVLRDRYQVRWKGTVEQLEAALDAETWYTASEAQGVGLVDQVTDHADSHALAAVAGFNLSGFRNVPASLQSRSSAMTITADITPQTPAAAATPPAAGPTIAQPIHDTSDGPLTATDPPARPQTSPNASPARTRPVSAVRAMVERLTGARLTGNVAQTLSAALADITPAGNGVGNEQAGLMTQALGELWSGVDYTPIYRPHVMPGSLTGAKVNGFRWAPAPTVAEYSGNKAAVPSNAAKLELEEVSPSRLAGGHDIDRIYRDLGSPDVLESYWRQMTRSLAVQLDAKAHDAILAAAGTLVTGQTNTLAAIITGTMAVQAAGGTASYALISTDLAIDWATTSQAQSPQGAPFVNIPPVTVAGDLAAGTVIVGDRRAVRQLTFEPPVRAEAVNIPNGGIDAGLFSYCAELIENAAAVIGYTVGTPVTAATSSSKAK